MCRVLAYLGDPLALEHVLFETDSSLVRQSYSPRMMKAFLNLAGFGMVAWDDRSVRSEEPFTYRVTTLPSFDRNLHALAAKLAPTCLVAHVRGITYSAHEMISDLMLFARPPKLNRTSFSLPEFIRKVVGGLSDARPCSDGRRAVPPVPSPGFRMKADCDCKGRPR